MKSEEHLVARVQLSDGDMVEVTHIVDISEEEGWVRFMTTKTAISFNANVVDYYVVAEMSEDPPDLPQRLH